VDKNADVKEFFIHYFSLYHCYSS